MISQYLPKSCAGCHRSDTLVLWPHLAKNPILLSVGHIRRIEIPVLCCTNCSTANYPDMMSCGVFPIHNKCLISIDYILDLKDILISGIYPLQYSEVRIQLLITVIITGASVIDSIKNKIELLSLMHELEDMEVNLTNVAISIEQCAIGNVIIYVHNSETQY
jgi:hypothetical protein